MWELLGFKPYFGPALEYCTIYWTTSPITINMGAGLKWHRPLPNILLPVCRGIGHLEFGQLINCEIILDFSFSSSLTFCWVSYWNILHTCLFVTMMPKISNEFICRDFFWFSLSTARCPTDCPPWCAQCPAGVPPLCPPFWLRPMICQHTRSRIYFPPAQSPF